MIRAAVLALAGCGAATSAPRAPAEPHIAAIDTLAAAAIPRRAGVAVVVMRGDRVVHAAGYGDLTPTSVVPLASLSKHVWATGFAQLVDEGKLDVSARVTTVFPEFPAGNVTIEHLLEQRSGLTDDHDGEDDEHFTDVMAPEFAPGSWWLYSNRGAILARRVLEKVTGMPWSQYLRQRIAAPLHLASFTTCQASDHLYHGPPMSDDTWRRVQFVCGNALDVARFERGIETLLSPSLVERMRTPVAIEVGDTPVALGYGWFTRTGDLDGHRGVGHSGNFDEGVSVMSLRFPADDLTIAVLMNGAPAPGATAPVLATRIARVALGLAAPAVHEQPVPADLLAAIAGEWDLHGIHATITARDGRAWLSVGPWTGALVYVGGTTFLGGPDGVDPDRPMQFVLDHGVARAALVGHRFVLDGVARRITP